MKNKKLSLLLLLAPLLLVGCDDQASSSSEVSSSESSSSEVSSSEGSSNSEISSGSSSSQSSESSSSSEAITYHTVAELKEIAKNYTSSPSEERYYIKATIKTITDAQYGGMVIEDETGELDVYGTYSADGSLRYSALEEKPVAGDEVTLYGNLQTYKGEAEIYSGWIIDFTHEKPDISEYKSVSVAEARKAEKGDLLRVKGRVLSFTYNYKMQPVAFLLADSTGSIYVYDNVAANTVKLHQDVELTGTKDYFIAEDDQYSAEEFSYNGSNQLTDVTVISHTDNSAKIDYSFAEEITVKELLETPVSEDIAGKVYKSQAYITVDRTNADQAGGYTNYYINDIDKETGSYVYTQANGKDYTWLDQYENQYVTLYYSPLNAGFKQSSGFWRLVPIEIESTGLNFDLNDATKYTINYEIKDQFDEQYFNDPDLVLPSTYSNEDLGIANVQLTYESSNKDAAYFETQSDGVHFHTTKSNLEAELTISATLEGYASYSVKLNIETIDVSSMETETVKEAIEASDSTEVTIKGIAGPSLINQSGFYLIDETGAIAVRAANSKDMFTESFEMGDTVIIKGTRDTVGKYPSKTQIVVDNATVFANLQENTDYPTTSFIKDKDVEYLAGLNTSETSHTAEIYTVTATITKGEDYIPYKINDGNKSLQTYQNSSSQYAWLDSYVGKEVTLEVALCNWNSKSAFKICILSVTDGTNTSYNTHNYK
ncbi:MAG: hypothetical protein IAC78_03495 [Firmicutes bacterium]|uniref:Nucleic acid-binding domain protein n=1 Tax=Candidatus Scatoplasma merdavium TaxID=2840932 RepID=A0A9D9GM60_9BACL|nr:hypothetical protein [Candidatus Scatoplasma merdavium]